jgi:hypothetical protein
LRPVSSDVPSRAATSSGSQLYHRRVAVELV